MRTFYLLAMIAGFIVAAAGCYAALFRKRVHLGFGLSFIATTPGYFYAAYERFVWLEFVATLILSVTLGSWGTAVMWRREQAQRQAHAEASAEEAKKRLLEHLAQSEKRMNET